MNKLLLFIVVTCAPTMPPPQEQTPPKPTRRDVNIRDGETVTLKVAVSDKDKNLLTAVSFPESISQIVSAWLPKDLSIEHEGRRFFLKLLSKSEGHLDAILTTGSHVRLFLQPTTPDLADSHVSVRLTPISGAKPRSDSASPSGEGAVDLIKAMRLGEIPAAASVRSGGRVAIFSTSILDGRLLRVYDTARFSGFVVEVTNRSVEEAFHLDLTTFSADRLVVAGSKDVILKPESSTDLYLVFWK